MHSRILFRRFVPFFFLILLFSIASDAPLSAQTTATSAAATLAVTPQPQSGTAQTPAALPFVGQPSAVSHGAHAGGTVTDENGDLVPGATVMLDDGNAGERLTAIANDSGEFEFANLRPGAVYHATVHAPGFVDWNSPTFTLAADEYFFVKDIELRAVAGATSVTVSASPIEIATEQVHLEEQQRVMGFIPNFYVVYDSANAAPMTAKLKFQMAFRAMTDPITFLGTGAMAGIYQASDTPNYVQGAKGYGERFGMVYADGLTDLMFGGAILPSLLHQDPRYFYQGTGSKKSRLAHALAGPFICKGDNGKWQPNYSSMGGDVISSAISNLYYPSSNRGPSLIYGGFLISTAEREVSTVVQEFVLRKLTPRARRPTE